jgi:hypothetical protein
MWQKPPHPPLYPNQFSVAIWRLVSGEKKKEKKGNLGQSILFSEKGNLSPLKK